MTALPAWADVRETIRLDASYDLARRASQDRQRASDRDERSGAARRLGALPPLRIVWRVFVWSLWPVFPVLAWPAFQAALEARGGSESLTTFAAGEPLLIGALLAIVLANRVGSVAAKFDVFSALRMPSPQALVVARLVKRAPLLLWSGLCLAAAAWMQIASWRLRDGDALVVAACAGIALLPAFFAARAVSRRVSERTVHSSTTWWALVASLLLIVVLSLLVGVQSPRFWLLVVGWHIVAGNLRGRRFAQGFPFVAADGIWMGMVTALVVAPVDSFAALPAEFLAAAAMYFAAYPFVAIALLLRETMRDVARMELVKVEADTDTAGSAASPAAGARERVRAPGRGLWRASWEKWWAEERPSLLESTGGLGQRLGHLVGHVLAWLVVAFRALIGPAIVAVAVADYSQVGMRGVFTAALGAYLARTFVGDRVSARLHLLGVDYVEQVRHEMRAMLVATCLPAMAVALAAAWMRDFRPAALFGCAAVAAFFVLRIGWPGIATERWRLLGCVPFVAAAVALAFVPSSSELAVGVVAVVGALGLVGIALRFARLDEPALREQMRAQAE